MNSAALISDSEKFNAIGKSTEIGFLVVLENGKMIDVNQTASQWLELSSSRKSSQNIQSLIPDGTICWNEIALESVKSGEFSTELRLFSNTDKSLYLNCDISFLKKSEDQAYFIIILTKTAKSLPIQKHIPSEVHRNTLHLHNEDDLQNKIVSETGAPNGQKIETLLQQKTIKLNTIASVNSSFIKKQWKEALQSNLESIANTVNADRVYYYENSYSDKGKTITSIDLEWCRAGISSQIDNSDHHGYTEQDIPDLLHTLANNKPYTASLSELPEGKMRTIFETQKIKSLLTIPVTVDNRFWGFIGFDDCKKERNWENDEISFLSTISLNLASAIKNEEAKKEINRALIEKNRILESIDDGFFTVDRYWIVTYWNRRAEKIFNISRFEIVGKNLWDLFDESSKAEFYTANQNAVQNQSKTQFEKFLSKIDSWLEFVIYPTEDGLSVYFKNINDRKESENKMNELNRSLKAQTKELEISNTELEQFAYVASHDLQEPLRMITSFLNQIEKKYSDKLDERGRKYIQFVTDGAHRMRQIILDLLEFSKIGSMDRVRKNIDMNKVLERVILSNKQLIKSKKAKITSEKLPEIYASEIQMQQLFRNLISNAVKYQEIGGIPKVYIDFEESEQYWIFSIKDNGIGIDIEYKSRIFEIFQRLHGINEYSGTGIGLAICKKIVEEHKGEIWFESEIGNGSVFYFSIRKDQHLYS